MTALIIGNGRKADKKLIENLEFDYVICADGGLEKAKEYGIIPNVIIGDFDSVDLSVLKEYDLMNIHIEKFDAEKDFTDMELAIEFAISKGYRNIILAGASGSRLDHTLANIMLMDKYYKEGISVTIVDNENKGKIISDNSELAIEFKQGYFVSIIPITDSIQDLNLEGFKYNLHKVTVQRGSTLCISNQVTDKHGKITLGKGRAIVFISKD